jgi:nucleoside-diphosphate-sugar epimerase
MKKCITIGSSGFIGKNLVKYLGLLGHSCTNLSRKQLYDIKKLDFNDFDVVVHTAGLAHDLKKGADELQYYKANFELTKKLYDRFLNSAAKKFIFLSSVKAVADDIDGVLTENAIPLPKTEYGRTKLMAEQYLLRQPLPADKSVYILRPCMTHGEGNKGNLNLLYKIVHKGVPYPLAAFNNKRSLLSINNLCFIINEIIERDDIPTDIYNVSDDQPLSTSEVVSILASTTNKKARLWRISPALIRMFARICDVLHLPLTTERLNKLTENYVVSNAKIKSVLKRSLPLSSTDGLKITANSFNNAI